MKKPVLPMLEILSKGKGQLQRWICETFHRTAGPFRDEKGRYQRCLDCGRRIPWDSSLSVRDPRGDKAA